MSRRRQSLNASLFAAGAVLLILAGVIWILRGDSEESPQPVEQETAEAAPRIVAPEAIAARVVEAMHSFDHTTPGRNSWLEERRADLTENAYAYMREMLGPGDGPSTTPLWTELLETKGYQRVRAGDVNPDPDVTTNTDTWVTLQVWIEIDTKGITSDLGHGDGMFTVNLERPDETEQWRVAAVIPSTVLLEDYSTRRWTPRDAD